MNTGVRKELSFIVMLMSIVAMMRNARLLAGMLGMATVLLAVLPSSKANVKKRSVVVTGGSRGLGLALAQRFLKAGANVTLLARDEDELNRAKEMLQNRIHSDHILIARCDVTNREELQQAFERVEERFGRLDILVNNAGTITVGAFESMEAADFEALTRLQVQAVVNAVQLAIPYFLKNGEGQIVNISSIGGKLPVPHMTTYCTGKFGLAGFSEALGIELAQDNIFVTTVYPGLMRTGSPIQAVFKGDHEKEYAWFQTGDVSPVLSVSATYAADKIFEGVRNRDAQVMFPVLTKAAVLAYHLFPETYTMLMRQAVKLLPRSESKQYQTGAFSQGWLDGQRWYWPFKRIQKEAELTWNQAAKEDAEFNLGV